MPLGLLDGPGGAWLQVGYMKDPITTWWIPIQTRQVGGNTRSPHLLPWGLGGRQTTPMLLLLPLQAMDPAYWKQTRRGSTSL